MVKDTAAVSLRLPLLACRWRYILPYLQQGEQGSAPPALPGAIYMGLLPLQINTELLLYNLTASLPAMITVREFA
jgi:hypothetical protein